MNEHLQIILADQRKREAAYKRAHNCIRLTGNPDKLNELADAESKNTLSRLKLDCQCRKCGLLKFYFKTKSDLPKHQQDRILQMECSGNNRA
jgi:hypothetical protein